jgi:hypothetical protein
VVSRFRAFFSPAAGNASNWADATLDVGSRKGRSAMMKKITLIVLFVSLASCNFQAIGKNTPTVKAVYFVHGQGELSWQDLQTHPEVVVVQAFDEFKKDPHQKIALWVDRNATPFDTEQENWINEAPQTYFPIVLIGTSDTLHSFRDLLRLHGFQGPAGDYPGRDAPGFSVIQWKEGNEPDAREVIFMQGYNQKPTVQAILEITNALLEGKLKATPTASFVPIATPTP